VLARRGVQQHVVLVRPRLVVVVDLGQLGVREDPSELRQAAAGLEAQSAALVAHPAALPFLLVLVAARVADARPGLDIVEPHVLDTRPVRPRLLAGDAAGVASDALVEVHHHRHLRHDLHQYSTSWLRRRITVTSSRWFPVGPR
jgi:hypothetical protein